VPSYDTLKNKQNDLIRKALDGSAFVSPYALANGTPTDPIDTLTEYNASAVIATLDAPSNAQTVVTGGNLVLKINGSTVTTTLAASDNAAAIATKITTAAGSAATASIVSGKLHIVTVATGEAATIEVVSGTGDALTSSGLVQGQVAYGKDSGISLRQLPALWDDLGWLTTDGASHSRDVASSDVQSWGSVTPTRTDITSDTTAVAVVAQETKLLTIGLASGVDTSTIVADADTGEVSIAKPTRPRGKYWRVMTLAVDLGDGGEIYVGRFLPRAKVTNYTEQNYGQSDDPISWGVTLTGETDPDLGYSERWLFGGPGWNALLDEMGIPRAEA
jgi:hypothetical protein